MKDNIEKLFEGTYQYFQNGQNYSQENFTVSKIEATQNVLFEAEIMSRVETGEFFKMKIAYVVSQFYAPQTVIVEKSLGEKIAKEVFDVDYTTQTLRYTFKSSSSLETVERPFSSKHHIIAPCFLTAGLFTLTKKIDSTARTPVTFITTANEWEFHGPPVDKILWIELKAHDTEELLISGAPLTASKFEIHEEDALTGDVKPGAQLWVSKHYGVPYQLVERDGAKIVVRKLKKLKQEMGKMF
jgi:hypothetical protein